MSCAQRSRPIHGRRPVSAVAGDLPMEPDVIVAAVETMARTRVEYVKVGLFPGPAAGLRARAGVPARTTKIIGVMFADRGADNALVKVMAGCGFAGAMLDTSDKARGRAARLHGRGTLAGVRRRLSGPWLMTGLAGSLEAPDVPRLLLLAPDYLGFRGALCVGVTAALASTPHRSASFANSFRSIPTAQPHETRRGKGRLSAAGGEGIFRRPVGADAATDRIFVRDFVVPARIGAYAREHGKSQNVRFNVDVKVRRSGHSVEDMRDVFSYDVITDGIRIIVAQEHIAFLETLAERVADWCFAIRAS
jgi:dihydroneopterin aldolase